MEKALMDLLSIYNETFFSRNQLEMLLDAVRKGHADRTVANARLWHLSDEKFEDVARHLSHRVPIYYGEPMMSGYPSYSDKRLKEVRGYTTEEALCVLSQTPLLTYCFGGPVYNLDHPTKEDIIIHACGINFESTTTEHYRRFVSRGGVLDEGLYSAHVRRILRCIYGAVKTLGYSRLFLPFLGLGQFLLALRDSEKRCARRGFFVALAAEAGGNPGIRTEVRGLPRDVEAVRDVLDEIDFETSCGGAAKVLAMNLVDTSGCSTVVVNPADNYAFVGNGGCNDPTLDGFIVSGERLKWRTTVYLHNDALSKLSERPDTAIEVEVPDAVLTDDAPMSPPPPVLLRRSTTTGSASAP